MINEINKWLFAIVISFVFDKKRAEDILDEVVKEFVERKNTLNPRTRNIEYEFYLIAKKYLFK